MASTISVTKRTRKRRLKSGVVVKQVRFIVNSRHPRTGKRKQYFFDKRKDAEAKREALIANRDAALHDSVKPLTVDDVVKHWRRDREVAVKKRTFRGYEEATRYILRPLLVGTAAERKAYTETGRKPDGARAIEMLGHTKIADLTTADIRVWHRTVQQHVGYYTANRAKMFLNAALALAAEDFHVRVPTMPRVARGKRKEKKAILAPHQIGPLIEAARRDKERGIYYAFPFLAGTRPSEQLALLWDDIDFAKSVILIHRMQELDGTTTNLTKTEAGMRTIPMGPILKNMLLEWRLSCPRLRGELYRVFPGPGRVEPWPRPRRGGGGPLLYQNFRNRYWKPVFKKLGLRYVTPHSARHLFISTLQATGVEVGLVAKLAGHANANVTLSHYTQAVRGGEAAVEALEQAYAAG